MIRGSNSFLKKKNPGLFHTIFMEKYSYFVHFTQITLIITPLLHSDLKYVERIVTFSLISLYSQVDKQRSLSLRFSMCYPWKLATGFSGFCGFVRTLQYCNLTTGQGLKKTILTNVICQGLALRCHHNSVQSSFQSIEDHGSFTIVACSEVTRPLGNSMILYVVLTSQSYIFKSASQGTILDMYCKML